MKEVSRLPDGHYVSPLRAHFRNQLQTAQRHVIFDYIRWVETEKNVAL